MRLMEVVRLRVKEMDFGLVRGVVSPLDAV
jgi:hypothetical protein